VVVRSSVIEFVTGAIDHRVVPAFCNSCAGHGRFDITDAVHTGDSDTVDIGR
jgi:hypothetical protein